MGELVATLDVDCSPRTRGWTPDRWELIRDRLLLPAHAGMDPVPEPGPGRPCAAPRARGDGPPNGACTCRWPACSPRTRGWTQARLDGWRAPNLLPAHAGMDPGPARRVARPEPAPRARGDGPVARVRSSGDRHCSPRTRGWTRDGRPVRRQERLLPAHAGMDPGLRKSRPRWSAAPRARGDGPPEAGPDAARGVCSPRTRGWTRTRSSQSWTVALLPAHAGMDPRRGRRPARTPTAPRARGDGPLTDTLVGDVGDCSPRTRGWTRAPRVSAGGRVPAPRARGDGPYPQVAMWLAEHCSPRTRGWTHQPVAGDLVILLLPAHAGMDPPPMAGRGTGSPAPRARGDGPC